MVANKTLDDLEKRLKDMRVDYRLIETFDPFTPIVRISIDGVPINIKQLGKDTFKLSAAGLTIDQVEDLIERVA